MTGNSITRSQGERSGSDRYSEDVDAEPDKRDLSGTGIGTGRLAQTGENHDGKPAGIDISIRLIHFRSLSLSLSEKL